MIEAVLGALALIAVTVIGYIFGRKKNTSEIKKNEADTKKSVIEAEKLDTENKLMQIELFERLNEVLSAQNEKLLKSNAKLVKSNEIVAEVPEPSDILYIMDKIVLFDKRIDEIKE